MQKVVFKHLGLEDVVETVLSVLHGRSRSDYLSGRLCEKETTQV